MPLKLHYGGYILSDIVVCTSTTNKDRDRMQVEGDQYMHD